MARDVRILFAMLCALSPLVLLAGAAGAEPQSRNMIVAQDSGDTSAEPEEKHKRKGRKTGSADRLLLGSSQRWPTGLS